MILRAAFNLLRATSLLMIAHCWPAVFAEEATNDEPDLFSLPIEELKKIQVLSPSRSNHSVPTAPNIVTVINSAQIRAMGARTLSDLLKMLPGIQIENSRAGQDSVWIRGILTGRNTKVLMLIDGVPQQEMIFGEWSPDEQIPLINIERIEVIRGPGSALYGGNAYSGLISVFTQSHRPAQSRITIGYDEFDGRRAEFNSGIEVGDFDLLTTASLYKTDGYPMRRDREGRPSTHENNVSAYSTQVKLLNNTWQAALNYNDYFSEYPMYPSLQYKEQDYRIFDGYVKHEQGHNSFQLENQFYWHRVQRRFENSVRNANDDLTFWSYSDLDSTLYGLRSQLSYAFNASHNLIVGVQFERRDVRNFHETITLSNGLPTLTLLSRIDRNGDPAPDSDNFAVYVQQESSFWQDELTLTAGLRLDHYEQFDAHLSPRFGLTYHPKSEWSAKLLWGQAFRPPTLLEQFEVRSDGNSPGNPDVKPENIETIEGEWMYAFNHRSDLVVRHFRSKLTDFIRTVNRAPYENVDEDQIIPGYEIEWNVRGSSRFLAAKSIGMTLNYTRTNTDIESIAKNSANILLFFESERTSAYFGLNYLGRRNASSTYHSSVIDPALRARDNKGHYLIFDTRLRWQPTGNSNWHTELIVHNLFDQEHSNPTSEPDAYYDVRKEPRNIELRLNLAL